MTESKIIGLLEEMLELEAGTLALATKLHAIEEWDSVAAISLIALMDENGGKKLTGAMIKKFKTVGDIVKVWLEA